jgi:hypothetical protein
LHRLNSGNIRYAAINVANGRAKLGIYLIHVVLKASAGNATKVTELMEVPTIPNPMTHPENDLPPTKYCSVLLFLREKYIPIPTMNAK